MNRRAPRPHSGTEPGDNRSLTTVAARRAHRLILLGISLIAAAAAACGAITWLSLSSLLPAQQSLPFVGSYGALFLIYLLGLRILRILPWSRHRKTILLVTVALLLRVVLLPAPPLLDDDIYRYRWDGKVLAHGINPYAFPPEARELAALQQDDPLFERIGFQDIPAVYPPASQALFAAGYALTPNGIWGIKILVVICDLAAVLALIGLLRALRLPTESAAVYAWNPLVLKEFANSGHHDAAGIALLLAGLWALANARNRLAAASLAAATLVKPILLLLSPGLWRRLGVRDALLWAALIAAAYLPFSQIGFRRLFAGMSLYTRYWEMNDSLFALIQRAFGGPLPSRNAGFLFETNPAARITALAMWSLAAAWLLYDAIRERRAQPLTFGPPEGGLKRSIWRMGVLLAVVLTLTPTMDPWYLCWLVPFIALFSWRPGLLWTGTVALSYLYYWQDRDFWWLRPAEYLPVLLFLCWDVIRSRR